MLAERRQGGGDQNDEDGTKHSRQVAWRHVNSFVKQLNRLLITR
jgi:hypothetical protein